MSMVVAAIHLQPCRISIAPSFKPPPTEAKPSAPEFFKQLKIIYSKTVFKMRFIIFLCSNADFSFQLGKGFDNEVVFCYYHCSSFSY